MPTLTPIAEKDSSPLCSESLICTDSGLTVSVGANLFVSEEGSETLTALAEFLDETALYPGTSTFPGTSVFPQTPLLRLLMEV